MSSSSSRAVSMMIGTLLVARRRLQTSSPSSFGSIRSSTTRSKRSSREARQRLLAVACLDHTEPVAFERIGEELLNRVLVVDEQDGGRVWHRSACRRTGPPPTIATAWRRSRPVPRGDARAEGRSSGRSAGACIAAPGCSSGSRCCGGLQRAQARPAAAAAARAACVVRRPSAVALAAELARSTRTARRGAAGAAGAAQWVREQLTPYGLQRRARPFRADVPGLGERTLVNQVVTVPGSSPDEIVVLAHRDDDGTGPGANNNASGIAALIELARSYGDDRAAARASQPAAHARVRGHGRRRVRRPRRAPLRRDTPRATSSRRSCWTRSPATAAAPGAGRERAAARLARVRRDRRRSGCSSRRASGRRTPSALAQLVDLGFPFTLHEQGPLLAQRDSGADADDAAASGRPAAFADRPDSSTRCGSRSSAARRSSSCAGWTPAPSWRREPPATSTSARACCPGWAIELVLLAALLPFLRRRGRPVRPLPPAPHPADARAAQLPQPAGFWLWAAILFELFALIGVWPSAPAVPLPPGAPPGQRLAGDRRARRSASWSARLAGRPRSDSCRGGRSRATEELAGATAALLALAVVALLVVATNPFALIFLLPVAARLALAAARASPADLDAPGRARRRLSRAVAAARLARVPLRARPRHALVPRRADRDRLRQAAALAIAVAWFAAAGQMTALTVGRYAPYPSARERPPRGPLREAVRRTVLTVRAARRRRPGAERRALEG